MENYYRMIERAGLNKNNHQEQGVKWCLSRELQMQPICGVRGGFVADEMGLGKTIMIIGAMVCNVVEKTLIVVPPALIDQWAREVERSLLVKAYVFHGREAKTCSIDTLKSKNIVLTTYDTLASQLQSSSVSIIHRTKWNRVILDEGHHLRNKNTRRFIGVSALERDITWIISGTPIQNRKEDFYNLCSILQLPRSFYEDEDNVTTIARFFVLKRTKKEVGIFIPKLTVVDQNVEWQSEKEKELSAEIHKNLSFSNEVGESKFAMLPLVALLRAKQACLYPKLLSKMIENDIGDEILAAGCNYSSKLDKIVEKVLENKCNSKGKLIFSQFRDEMDTLKRLLVEGGIRSIEILDGRTVKSERNKILGEKYDVLILQMKTGSEGLNLQEHYSEIYFTSPSWNPYIEDQAIGRCHRLGQVNEVVVFKFKMTNGIEEASMTIDGYVTEVQETKRLVACSIYERI